MIIREKQKRNGKSRLAIPHETMPQLGSEEYTDILALLGGEIHIPTIDRTPHQRRLYKKISTKKMSIAAVKDPYRDMNLSRIMNDRRILLPSSEVPQCILHYYERSKGDGARKLHYAIKRSYYGIGQKTIQKEINSIPI